MLLLVGSDKTKSVAFSSSGGRVAQPSISLKSETPWVPRSSRTLRRAGTTNACATGFVPEATKVVSAALLPALAKKRLLRNSVASTHGGTKPGSSRIAAVYESPARKCRVAGSGTTRVRFSGRHEFRNNLKTQGRGTLSIDDAHEHPQRRATRRLDVGLGRQRRRDAQALRRRRARNHIPTHRYAVERSRDAPSPSRRPRVPGRPRIRPQKVEPAALPGQCVPMAMSRQLTSQSPGKSHRY